MEQTEIEQTLNELQKTSDNTIIYKAVGSIMVKAEKTNLTTELIERKELLNTRAAVLGKQEERLRSQLKEVQAKLQEDLTPISPPSP